MTGPNAVLLGAATCVPGRAELLDCSGHGAYFLGRRHPRVVAAVERLVRAGLGTGSGPDSAATSISSVAPPGLDHVVLARSGAEAIRAAVGIAAAAGHRSLVVVPGGLPWAGNAEMLEVALARARDVGDRTAVLLEPVDYEGLTLPPAGFLTEVSLLCGQYGALLIADEVHTGLGRLGRWWACDAEAIQPDILVIGQALGGGMVPVSAVAASRAIVADLDPAARRLISAPRRSPLADAAVQATLEVIEEEGLVPRARSIGAELLSELRSIVAEDGGDAVVAARGQGLLLGIECVDAGAAAGLVEALRDCHVLTSYTPAAGAVVRLTPPAVLTPGQVDRLLGAVAGAVARQGRVPGGRGEDRKPPPRALGSG